MVRLIAVVFHEFLVLVKLFRKIFTQEDLHKYQRHML